MKKIFFFVALLSASMVINAVPTTSAPVPTWPANQVMAVYSDSYTLAASWGYNESWGQTTTLQESEISGNHYLSYANFNYMGWGCAATYNVSMMEKLHLDIWADADGKLGIVPIYGGEGLTTDDTHRKIVDLVAGQWNSFDLDLATDFAGLNLSSIFQFKYDQGTVSEFCLDNVYFYRTTPLEDSEAPENMSASLASASFFSVTLNVSATDNLGVVNFIVKNGEDQVATGAGESGVATTVMVNNLIPATDYQFSVYATDAVGNACEPVLVNASTIAAPAAAPAPTIAADKVKSLYCDVYEPATVVNNLCDYWWQSPTLYQETLGEGDHVLYYVSALDGVFGWAFTKTDFVGFQKIHVSVYPTSAFTFEIYPVIAGEPHKVSEAMVANQWNEIVFDYTEYEAFDMQQLGFVNRANTEFFIDNVYFFQEEQTEGLNAVETGVKVRKVIENGQLIIIKNGARYDVTGAQIR